MMTLGVAGHAREIAVHRDALQGCRDIQLVHEADCAAVLEQKIDGLVLLHVEDKSHWIGVALAAGLHVMATHPVQELSHSRVCVLSLGKHTHFCSALAARRGVAHYSLELSFDSALFDPIDRETICNQAALDVCDLLLSTWGPVDVLYSRMRNFFHIGRMEDVSDALLRMRNGVEGSVALLDFTAVAPALRIRAYAQDEVVDTSWPWVWEADDLAAYYRNFVACIQGRAQPLLGLEQVAESYHLLEWMRMSARQDAILNRKQVK
ncbi:MAG: hypothetical protein OXI35_06160 [Gemmatimonadota bacterium]|nr:hypothetical protein [Gemmatimonadota bacterium]MYC70543.1 hypothetical protein [Gemmatimonadota bacterium]